MYSKKRTVDTDNGMSITPTYGQRETSSEIPKYELADQGLPPSVAYRIVSDELVLDGSSKQNLASFVTTWMDPEASQLMMDTLDKNMIDRDEYPKTAEIEMRCVNILSRLWNSPEMEKAVGCSTIGSSEAAMLAGMAMKRKWKKRMGDQGKKVDRPNLILGSNVQVCWRKFCNYWEVAPRFIKCRENSFHLRPDEAAELCDENTIGVIAIMGSTFDGSYEPVSELNTHLDDLQNRSGLDIPIHVDGASGGFVAPFLQPGLEWDFRLPRVKSINASGHKYGLVYPGIGWALWRDGTELPEELIFHCNYLGGDLPNYALNFSRPGGQIIAQYYNFLRLGREGYTAILEACQKVALHLSSAIGDMEQFELLTQGDTLPVFAWKFKDDYASGVSFTLYDLSERLRINGWLIPAYTMPEDRTDLVVQRIVVREGFSRDLADDLLEDIKKQIVWLESHPYTIDSGHRGQFSHRADSGEVFHDHKNQH